MIDPDLHLFLDERGISLRQHLYRRAHAARRESLEPVLPANGADEGTAIGYATATRDGDGGEYRLWYMSHADGVVRLAASGDARTWERCGAALAGERPFAVDNLAVVPVGAHADAWFRGARMAGYVYCRGGGAEGAARGLHLARSLDGRRLEVREPGILPGVGDRSSLTYDEVEDRYLLVSRPSGRTPGFAPGELQRVRLANLWTSRDLVDWQNEGIVLGYDDADRHDVEIYGLQPFRYGQGWLGLVEVYYRGIERLETQLAWSRDGRRWERVEPRDPVLPMGAEGTWDSHWAVSTNNPPLPEGDRLLILYSGASTKHGSKDRHRRSIGLATLRRDGWVSLEAGRTEGVMVTAPLPLERPMFLEINADCGTGYISTAVLCAEDGRESEVLPGYDAAGSMVEAVDAVRCPVRWGERRVVDPVPSGRCYLRFAMKQASFYGYRWMVAG